MRITKSISILLFLVSISFNTYAQIRSVLKHIDRVEIIGGPSIAYLRGYEDAKKYRELKVGFSGGLEYAFVFNEKFTVIARTLFERKGKKEKIEVQYYDDNNNALKGDVEYINNFDYLTLPVLARFSIGNSGFSFEAGIFAAYLLKEKVVVKSLYNNNTQNFTGTDDFKRFDYGLLFSGRYNLENLIEVPLSLLISSSIGLVNVSDLDPTMYRLYPVKTTSFNLSVGYTIL